MNINSLKDYIEKTWEASAIPALKETITIPSLSPAFDANWDKNGYLKTVLTLAESWVKSIAPDRIRMEIIQDTAKTPVLMIEIEATPQHKGPCVFLYGHLDKQPPSTGWDENKGAYRPVIENGNLYGRGSADDGYALFTAVTAIKALQENNIPHGRFIILIETCEESGSFDLAHYLEHYIDFIGSPDLIICLDSGCGDYEHLWITTSLRGSVVGELDVRILKHDVHSGQSGKIASSFRIIRQLLDRIEDAESGRLNIADFHTQVPEKRMTQLRQTADVLGQKIFTDLPMLEGVRPVSDDPFDLLIRGTWQPALSYLGADGIPAIKDSANTLRASTRLLLSIRTPPSVDTAPAAEKLKQTLELDPPFSAQVSFHIRNHAKGWDMPDLDPVIQNRVMQASQLCFNRPPCFTAEGGSIPFMNLLAKKFPDAGFIITGVLGPQSNAHGPNECLNLSYVKKLTLAIAFVIGSGDLV